MKPLTDYSAAWNRPTHMQIKAIMFDKDGTLIDFHATWGSATRKVLETLAAGSSDLFAKLAQASDFDPATNTIGNTSLIIAGSPSDLTELWSPILARPADQKFENEINTLYAHASQTSLTGFTTTAKTLANLNAAKIPLAVGTNDSEENAKAHMSDLGWTQHFDHIFGYDSGHGAKPGPGMIEAFANHCGLAPSDIAMVGDSTHDMQAGRNAGAICIGVTTGPASAGELMPFADHVIDDLGKLLALI